MANDLELYNNLKGTDLGSKDDGYFRGLDPRFNNGRQGAIDFMSRMQQQDPVEIAKSQAASQAARFAQNKQDLGDYTTKLSAAVPAALSTAEQKYGVTDQLAATQALRGRIADLRGNLSGGATGGYASQSQVDSAVNSKYLPQYNLANQNLSESAGLAANEARTSLIPITTEGDILRERIARESTGYTQQQQSELDTLLHMYDSGVALSEAQLNRAQQLSQTEAQAKNTAQSSRYITVGKSVYDTQTGQWVSAPGGGAAGNGISVGGSDPLGIF